MIVCTRLTLFKCVFHVLNKIQGHIFYQIGEHNRRDTNHINKSSLICTNNFIYRTRRHVRTCMYIYRHVKDYRIFAGMFN